MICACFLCLLTHFGVVKMEVVPIADKKLDLVWFIFKLFEVSKVNPKNKFYKEKLKQFFF